MKISNLKYHYCIYFLVLFSFSCQEKTPVYHIGISQCSDDEWRNKMNIEMKHEALLHQGVMLDIKTVVDDSEKQIQDIESFIEQKVDLIIVSPNKAVPVTPVIEKAYQLGIPVILVDRKILSDQYTAFIGADNYQIGKEVGNYAVNLLKGKGNIVELEGLDGSTPALDRHQGFYSIVCKHPDIKLIFREDAAWLKDIAEKKMEDALAEYPKIDLVFAHNDRMAIGAYNTAKAEGRSSNIYFLGIDALPGENGGIEQVLAGKLDATFIYPTGGDKTIQLALDILEGKPFEKNNTLYTAVVDKTNARVLKLQSDQIIEQENKIDFLNKRVDSYLSQYTTQRNLLYSFGIIVLLLIVLFAGLYLAYRSKNRLNIELSKRNDEINEQKNMLERQRDQLILLSKQLETATHAKLVFFTNISHEFRTPLTLISGPVNSLLEDKTISPEQKRLLILAQRNIKMLLNLIDQIVDFRKYENGKMILNLVLCDLKQQLIEWNEPFSELAKKKHLTLNFYFDSGDNYLMVLDIEKMERIYLNLLSNAFKFTPEQGYITITLNKKIDGNMEYVEMKISNSGSGISEEDINHIFDRFYQVDSHLAGSGIGLALVKAMVELHEGSINVNSDSNGWTTFVVRIPLNQLQTSAIEKSKKELQSKIPEIDEDLIENKSGVHEIDFDETKYSVLVVDDNPDIRAYIKMVIQGKYTILEAGDGEEGFNKALKYIPDVIISDVMMPKMDGIEFCLKLKSEVSTSHIPVILLTACSLDEQRIVGFKSGVDDYISKPFNPDVLEVRIANLIENRNRLKGLYREGLFSDEDKSNSNTEKSFLNKFIKEIELKLNDSELNVEDLSQSMGLTRTALYRKIKSLTNYSPNEILRIIRLKKAHQLLSTTDLNISEITYNVGFTSPSYFTKCFKEYYKESPTDYQKRIR